MKFFKSQGKSMLSTALVVLAVTILVMYFTVDIQDTEGVTRKRFALPKRKVD